MDINILAGIFVSTIILIIVAYFIGRSETNRKLEKYKSISEAIEKESVELSSLTEEINTSRSRLEYLNSETKELQDLKRNADSISQELSLNTKKLNSTTSNVEKLESEIESKKKYLLDVMSRLDLYTIIDEFVDFGHFEIPEYLYETSARFVEEIKRVRESQKKIN